MSAVDVALTSFTLGVLSIANPCVLPLYPGFLAYLGGQAGPGHGRTRYFLGLFVLAGVMTTMLALGAVIALLSVPISRALAVLLPVAVALIIALGVLMLVDRNPFTRLPQIRLRGNRQPTLNAFAYGALYGPIAMPCSGPAVVAIFVYSFTLGEAISQLWAFAWFGLGLGVPLLAISLVSGSLQRELTRWFAARAHAFNVVGGLLLIVVGLYGLYENWGMLTLYYG